MNNHHISQSELRELLGYDPLTGNFVWLVDRPYRRLRGKIAGSFDDDGYRQIKINRRVFRAHRLAWLYSYGKFPDRYIDHINGDKSDNKLCNLREATDSENLRNQPKHSDGTSGFKGVTMHKKSGKWQAACWANGRQQYLGLFLTAEDASVAYADFAKIHHGDFFCP